MTKFMPVPDTSHFNVERFWKRVDRNGSGCWPWVGKDSAVGYGRCYVLTRKVLAHRVAYLLYYGINPGDMGVLHSCDNPPCCNPTHLFLGTDLDNYVDSCRKGRRRYACGDANGTRKHPETRPRGADHGLVKHPERRARGERQGSARLTDDDVAWIRLLFHSGCTITGIFGLFDVSYDAIRRAATSRTWKHLPP